MAVDAFQSKLGGVRDALASRKSRTGIMPSDMRSLSTFQTAASWVVTNGQALCVGLAYSSSQLAARGSLKALGQTRVLALGSTG